VQIEVLKGNQNKDKIWKIERKNTEKNWVWLCIQDYCL